MNINKHMFKKVSSIIILLSTLGVVMEQVKFNYSMKNIPIPPKNDFMIQMIQSVEKFVKNLRWRTFFFLNPADPINKKETYGFPSTKPAPQVDELTVFESKMYELTKKIKFKNHGNAFQSKLKDDVININEEPKMIIAADKTNNFYKIKKEDYNDLLQKNITKEYIEELMMKHLLRIQK